MECSRFNIAKFGWVAQRDVLRALDEMPATALASPGMGIPFLVVQDFAAAQHVLVTDEAAYSKPGIVRNTIIQGLGHNLFTAQSDEWLSRRRPVAPVFAAAAMDDLASIMAATIAEQLSAWQPGTFDMQAEVTDMTMRIACRAFLGVDSHTDPLGQAIQREFATLLDWLATHLSNPALPPAWVPTPNNRAMKRAKANLREAVAQLIEQRRSSGMSAGDVLGRLLEAQETTGSPNDDSIIDECIGFIFAGHETTASTLTWALYELARDSATQERLATEGKTLDLGSETLHDDAASMTVTDAVVEETLRLYPSGVSIVRTAKRTTQIGSHKVRRGTMVMIALQRIQRQPDVWEQPDVFDPERPLPPTEAGLRDSFLAFGLGPRRCLGARFARTEMRLALATICANWKLSYDQPLPPVAEVAPALRVAGELRLTTEPRWSG